MCGAAILSWLVGESVYSLAVAFDEVAFAIWSTPARSPWIYVWVLGMLS
jgi:hypothetical protein